jgi:hypothetical protein
MNDTFKFLLAVMTGLLVSCSPYQRLTMNPSNLSQFLKDTCDLNLIKDLDQTTDNLVHEDSETSPCYFYSKQFLNSLEEDSIRWFLTIKPVQVGKKETVVGSLYTLPLQIDSAFVFERRIKEYSQKSEFEGGKYMGFTYYIENDSTSIIKLGTREY